MNALWAWFLGTRVGRYAAGALAIAVIVGVAVLRALALGRAQQRARIGSAIRIRCWPS